MCGLNVNNKKCLLKWVRDIFLICNGFFYIIKKKGEESDCNQLNREGRMKQVEMASKNTA